MTSKPKQVPLKGRSELETIGKAVNESAGKVSVLWTSFILLSVYLAITTASITDRDLLLDSSVKMPVLGVDLPVSGYFAVAPVVLLMLHVYLALQVSRLFRKSGAYQSVLAKAVPASEDRELIRLSLDDLPYVRLIPGGSDRSAATFESVVLVVICWVTTSLVPLLILLQLFLAFLPFHDSSAAWLQRLCIVVDLALSWLIWASWRAAASRRRSRLISSIGAGATVATGIFILFLATFPGEFHHRNPVKSGMDALASAFGAGPGGLSKLLFEGDIDAASGRSTSIFSNRLVLPDAQLYAAPREGLPNIPLSLRGRDLRGAILRRADLRYADLTGADLRDASLVQANLRNALLGCANIESSGPEGRGRIKLRGSSCTLLLLADLSEARLEGAVLAGADLRGARLYRARLSGADLSEADLSAAHLGLAKLYGADLGSAKLPGASLVMVEAMGARFVGADLRAAALVGVQAQGADFSHAQIEGMSFFGGNLYRAHFPRESTEPLITNVAMKPETGRLRDGGELASLSAGSRFRLDDPLQFGALVRYATGEMEEGTAGLVGGKLGMLDPASPRDPSRLEGDRPLRSKPALRSAIIARRIAILKQLMCGLEGQPAVVRGLLYNGRIFGSEIDGGNMLALLKDHRRCPGAAGLNAADLKQLQTIERDTIRARRSQETRSKKRRPGPAKSS